MGESVVFALLLAFGIGLIYAVLPIFLSRQSAGQKAQGASEPTRSWAALSAELKLAEAGRGLEGELEGFAVTLQAVSPIEVIIEVDSKGRIPDALWVTDHSQGHFNRPVGDIEHVETGDRDFDTRVCVQGGRRDWLGRLDQETRRAMSSFLELPSASIRRGRISLKVTGASDVWLVRRVFEMMSLAKQLGPVSLDLPRRLAQLSSSDPEPGTRQKSFQIMAEVYPGRVETREALLQGLRDEDPSVRLTAAQLAPSDAAKPALEELVRASGVPTSIRIAALDLLALRHSEPEIAPVVLRALQDNDEALLVAAARLAGVAKDSAAIALLEPHAASPNEEVALTVAKALDQIGGRASEPGLLRLADHASEKVRAIAIEALGRFGSLSAVEPLLQVNGRSAAARAQIRDAVRRIQERSGQSGEGQLSLVADKVLTGALSLPGDTSDSEAPTGGPARVKENE